jgi:hypothetical protein
VQARKALQGNISGENSPSELSLSNKYKEEPRFFAGLGSSVPSSVAIAVARLCLGQVNTLTK